MLNPRRRAVLDALVEGPVDPAALADRLELPPEAVVGHVEALRAVGFDVERTAAGFELRSVPAYGYGVQAGLDAPFVVDAHDELASTNDEARELAEAGAADVVVLADEQTAGRGRRGRRWASPPGGVYLSVVIRPTLSAARVGLLVHAAAVAAVEAAAAAGVDATIKWPNDLLGPDGAKLGGVLAESRTTDGEVAWAVLGLGLNADVDSGALPPGATSLRAVTGGAVDRRRVAQAFLESLDERRRDPAGSLPAWRERAATLGRRVRVTTPDGDVVGKAVDVDETGALLVRTDAGPRRVSVGDCEHLRPV